MKARSPVLGYNHNVRYAGRMWHVQTEDSGVQNPHLFTHLFADGTILATKKTDYEATAEVPVVQKLMQSQHKQMLRDLKAGVFDPKIEKFFGPIVRDEVAEPDVAPAPLDEPAPVPDAAPKAVEDGRATIPNLAPLLPPPAATPPTARPASPPVAAAPPPPPPRTTTRPPQARLTPARPSVAVTARGNPTPPPPPPPTIGGRASVAARPAPPTIGSGRSGVPQTTRATSEGVVMARPSVIVGSGQKKGEAADFWKSNERRPDPAFGGDLISEKSLDEVILAYLSEDAPKK